MKRNACFYIKNSLEVFGQIALPYARYYVVFSSYFDTFLLNEVQHQAFPFQTALLHLLNHQNTNQILTFNTEKTAPFYQIEPAVNRNIYTFSPSYPYQIDFNKENYFKTGKKYKF